MESPLRGIDGITREREIAEEPAAAQSVKVTTTGSDLFMEVSACLDGPALKWDKLAVVPTDGCGNLTGKNVRLSKQDKASEAGVEVALLHCIT